MKTLKITFKYWDLSLMLHKYDFTRKCGTFSISFGVTTIQSFCFWLRVFLSSCIFKYVFYLKLLRNLELDICYRITIGIGWCTPARTNYRISQKRVTPWFLATLQNAHAHLYKNKAVMNVNTLDIYLCPRFYATQLQKSENLIKKLTDIYIHIQTNTGKRKYSKCNLSDFS